MTRINTNILKSNRKLFLIIVPIILVFFVISLFTNIRNSNIELTDIPSSGESNVYSLVINEIQTSNAGNVSAPDGGVYDWIELYNGSSSDKDISNYSLSDNNNTIKWSFPKNTIIKSKSFLVVYLSGKTQDGLYASFRLKSSGSERLALRNSNKKIIDAVDIVSIDKGNVLARNNNGAWAIYDKVTPGHPNTLEGNTSYLKSITSDEESSLIINEFMPRNDGNFKNKAGVYSGYIELKNIGDTTINLSEYNISNDLNAPFKYQLPSINLKPDDIFLIFTSNSAKTSPDEFNATFKLSSNNGDVVLSSKGKIINSYSYESVSNGIAYIYNNKEYTKTSNISPGYENNSNGNKSYQKEYLETKNTLIISEVMSNNYSFLPQNGGKYYDWIELYNNSNSTINLKDYCLSKQDDECIDALPDVSLKPKEYYIVMASGNTSLTNNSYQHLSFKINSTTGLYLYEKDKIIHSIFIHNIKLGYSFGTDTSSGTYYYESPTPGKKNNVGVSQISATPTFSIKSGVYNNIDKLEIKLYGEGNIYYTTDGSNPTTSSKTYDKPITISKTTIIKAIAVGPGMEKSSLSTSSYIINENHELSVMSITLNPSDFNYINSNSWVKDLEVSSNAEYFNNDGTSFTIPCGIKLFGGSTRGPAKKSYSINFRKKYGAGTLEYQVFDNRDTSTYESLVLRTGSQDEFYDRAVIRDMLGTSLVDDADLNIDVQAYKTIVMYVNGKYWGLYFIREKVNEDFISNHYNVDVSDNVDLLRIDYQTKAGDTSNYRSLLNYIKNHDMSESEPYKYVSDKVDINSLIDFWVAEIFVRNYDIINCRFFSSPLIDNGKWKYIFYDLDFAFYFPEYNYFNFMTASYGLREDYKFDNTIIRNLMKNATFKDQFIKRLAYQLKNVWNKERTNKYLDNIMEELSSEIKRNHARWGYNYDNYIESTEYLREYLNTRQSYILKQAKSYFNLTTTQYKLYFGGLT